MHPVMVLVAFAVVALGTYDLVGGTPLSPWVPVSGDPTLHEGDPADAPATDRRSHVHC